MVFPPHFNCPFFSFSVSPADKQLLHGGYVCTSVTQVARETSSVSGQSTWGRFGVSSQPLTFQLQLYICLVKLWFKLCIVHATGFQ